MYNKNTEIKISDHVPMLMLASFLSPIVLGIATGMIMNDFSAGGGLGVFIMIGLWVLCFLSMAFDF